MAEPHSVLETSPEHTSSLVEPHPPSLVESSRMDAPQSQLAPMIKVFRGGDNDDDDSETDRNERGEGELSRWWQELRKRTPYYIPCLSWAQKYRWREQLLKDVLAGLAVGFILVPQC